MKAEKKVKEGRGHIKGVRKSGSGEKHRTKLSVAQE